MNLALLIGLIVLGLAGANAALWIGLISHLRRKYPLPVDLAHPDQRNTCEAYYGGYYLATWRLGENGEQGRFRGWYLLARGNGTLGLTPRGLHFWRRGTKRPLWIPYFAMRKVEVRLSDRLKIRGRMSLEVDWSLDGYELRSVFLVGGGVSATVRVAQWLESRIQPTASLSDAPKMG